MTITLRLSRDGEATAQSALEELPLTQDITRGSVFAYCVKSRLSAVSRHLSASSPT